MSWRAQKPSAPDGRLVRDPKPERGRRRIAARIVAILLALAVGGLGGCALHLALQGLQEAIRSALA